MELKSFSGVHVDDAIALINRNFFSAAFSDESLI